MIRRKYGNRKIEVDGIKFDSVKEAKRYGVLRQMEQAGLISDLRLQVAYEIAPSVVLDGRKKPARHYRADFSYKDEQGYLIVEDVKGFRTSEYKLKRHLVKALHGIEVTEI